MGIEMDYYCPEAEREFCYKCAFFRDFSVCFARKYMQEPDSYQKGCWQFKKELNKEKLDRNIKKQKN